LDLNLEDADSFETGFRKDLIEPPKKENDLDIEDYGFEDTLIKG
jgi:hypothetical protein